MNKQQQKAPLVGGPEGGQSRNHRYELRSNGKYHYAGPE